MNPAALSNTSGALLAGLAKTGDRQAFQELVRRRQSWLRQIALNVWRQSLRQNKLETVNEEVEAAGDDGQAPALSMDLDAALQQLSDHERTCIVLSYHEGLSHAEISGTLDLPLGTVKSHIRSGTEVLRSILDQEQQP